MSPPQKLVIPQTLGTVYRWTFANVSFEVDAGRGARITAFRFGDENILAGPDVHPLNFGSTFWTSPQSDWAWPPPVEIDSAPYTVIRRGVAGTAGEHAVTEASGASEGLPEGADIWFKSAPGPLGISVAKQFRVNGDDETVEIEYVMENGSDRARSVAPWEISRLPVGGLTFFPADGGVEPRSTLDVRQTGGAIWFDNEPGPTIEHQKVFAHGSEGWIAHLDIARRTLLIKTFPRVEPGEQAPQEAEIELYANPAHTYVEVEQQGAYRPIGPGERTSWTVTWRLRRLPPGIEATIGNKDLLALVRALKARDQPY